MDYYNHVYTIPEVREMMTKKKDIGKRDDADPHGFDFHGANRDLQIARYKNNPVIDTRYTNDNEFCALVTIALNSGHGKTCLSDLKFKPAGAKISFDYPATDHGIPSKYIKSEGNVSQFWQTPGSVACHEELTFVLVKPKNENDLPIILTAYPNGTGA